MRHFLALLMLALATPLFAADVVWDGGATTLNWADAANWSGDALPGAGDTAVFDGGVVPGGPVVFSGTAGDGIRVDNGSATALSVVIDLGADITLAGAGGWSIQVGAADSLSFTSASAGRVVATQDNISVAGALSLDVNCMLAAGGAATKTLTIASGATFAAGGTFRAVADFEIDADNSGGVTILAFNDIEIDGANNLLWDISGGADVGMTINGDIRATGNSAHFDMWSLLYGGLDVFNIDMSGDFDANGFTLFRIEGDYGFWTLSGARAFNPGAGGSFEDVYFGEFDIPAGASLAAPDGAFSAAANHRIGFYAMTLGGTFDAGDNELEIYGNVFEFDIVTLDVAPGATFVADGDVALIHVSAFTATFAGSITFGAHVEVYGNAGSNNVVAPGGTLTIEGDLHVFGGAFGAGEDGATATPVPATINCNGNVRVDPAGGYIYGEGVHNFNGDLDLGATSDTGNVTVWPDLSTNDFEVQIHLTRATPIIPDDPTQILAFEPTTGSAFAVNSVTATSVIEHYGCIQLGWLNFLAGDNGADWDGEDVVLGGAVRTGSPREITASVGDIYFDNLEIRELLNPVGAGDGVNITIRSTDQGSGQARISINWIVVWGDTSDDFPGDEANGGSLTIRDLTFEGNVYEAFDGDNGGRGAQLEFKNTASIEVTDLTVGDGSAANSWEGATLATSDLGLEFIGTLGVGANASITMIRTQVDVGPYTFDIDAQAHACIFIYSEFRAELGNPMTMRLGGQDISLIHNYFSRCDSDGVQIAAGSTVNAIYECSFRNGVPGGTHLTLNGLANAAKLHCDDNYFGEATGSGSNAFITATGTNRLNFRVLSDDDFGYDSEYTVDAAQAEAMDGDDGSDPDNQVTWSYATARLVMDPVHYYPGLVYDTTPNQVAAIFELIAKFEDSTVTEVDFEFRTSGDIELADIATATLYEDDEDDSTFAVGPGDELPGCLDLNVVNGKVTFSISNGDIIVDPPPSVHGSTFFRRWAVAITFAPGIAGKSGSIAAYLPYGGVTIATPETTIVSGLPLVFQTPLQIIAQPSDGEVDQPLDDAVVQVVDDEGNPVTGRSINVTAEIGSGIAGAQLDGTLIVATNPATGRATFSNLRINRAAKGYTLRFKAAVLAADNMSVVDTASFDVTGEAPPPKGGGDGGGGCVVQSREGWLIPAMIAAALARLCFALRPNRRKIRA